VNDFIFAVSTKEKPGGRYVAVLQYPTDDEESIAFNAETIEFHVPEKGAQGIGE
jgi:hypothetical protein